MNLASDIVTLSSTGMLPAAGVGKAAGGKAPAAVAAAPAASAPDRVELTSGKSQLDQLKTAAANEPDFRSDKVAAIRQQLADGSYRVAAGSVAEKLAGWLRQD